MEERKLLKGLVRGNEQALERVMQMYSPYVLTVIHNRSRGLLHHEDEEEIASDVFLSLWQNAKKIQQGQIRPWLGAVARNKTVSRLRRIKISDTLEENEIILPDAIWETLSEREKTEQVQSALGQLEPLDREIFYRYYDLCQTSMEIAEEMQLNSSTVRSRLKRGREQLRHILCQGGFVDENEN